MHGFLTVDGAKMSKSRGTFITAESYLTTGLNPGMAALLLRGQAQQRRWKTSTSIWKTSSARVNSDLVGKYVNIASRCAGFIGKKFGGKLASDPMPPGCSRLRDAAFSASHEAYEAARVRPRRCAK